MKQLNMGTVVALFILWVCPQAAAADPADPPASKPRSAEPKTEAPQTAPAAQDPHTEARKRVQSRAASRAPAQSSTDASDPTAHTDPASGNAATTLKKVASAPPAESQASDLPPRKGVPRELSGSEKLMPTTTPATQVEEPPDQPTQAAELVTPNSATPVPPTAENHADRELREQIQARLQAKEDLSKGARLVSVDVKGDTVTLRGQVPTFHEQFMVENVVRATTGVERVRSELRPREAPERPSVTATTLY